MCWGTKNVQGMRFGEMMKWKMVRCEWNGEGRYIGSTPSVRLLILAMASLYL